MKTPNGFVAAFVLASAVLAAPAASADAPKQPIEARFAFDPDASAARIYEDLNRTARRACELQGTRSLRMQKVAQACVKEMVDDGVAKIGRADIVAVHNGYFATASASIRG